LLTDDADGGSEQPGYEEDDLPGLQDGAVLAATDSDAVGKKTTKYLKC
jgi:hypothetical protein